MSILFSCQCGTELEVEDSLAGRTAMCPDCRRTMTVPAATRAAAPAALPRATRAPQAAPPPTEDDEAAYADSLNPLARSGSRRSSRRRDEDDEDDRPSRRRNDDGDDRPRRFADDEDDDRPRRSRRKRYMDDTPPKFWNTNTRGGLVAMGIGGALTLVAFLIFSADGDTIWFYPPILFVFGLIWFIYGAVKQKDN